MDGMTAIDYIREIHQSMVAELRKQIATLSRENEMLRQEIEALKQHAEK